MLLKYNRLMVIVILILIDVVASPVFVASQSASAQIDNADLIQWIKDQQTPSRMVPNPATGRDGLIVSYIVPLEHPLYNSLYSRSWMYDDALSVIVLSSESECATAESVIATVSQLVEADGKLSFSYNTQDSWYDIDTYHTGTIAWFGSAILYYQDVCLDTQFQPVAVKLANWILTMQDPYTKSILGGIDITWISTEHNIDAFFFLRDLGLATGTQAYIRVARQIQESLLINHWNSSYACFQQGVNDPTMALDTASWGSLFLMGIDRADLVQGCLDFLETNFATTVTCEIDGGDPISIRGYRPFTYSGHNFVWSEGSLGVALAYERAGDTQKANEIRDEVLKMQGQNGGILYACSNTVDFWDINFKEWESVAGTAWLLMFQSVQLDNFWDYRPIPQS